MPASVAGETHENEDDDEEEEVRGGSKRQQQPLRQSAVVTVSTWTVVVKILSPFTRQMLFPVWKHVHKFMSSIRGTQPPPNDRLFRRSCILPSSRISASHNIIVSRLQQPFLIPASGCRRGGKWKWPLISTKTRPSLESKSRLCSWYHAAAATS